MLFDDQRDAMRMKALAIAEALEVRAAEREAMALRFRLSPKVAEVYLDLASELRTVAKLIRNGDLEGAEDE